MIVIEKDENNLKKPFSRTLTNSLQNFRVDVEGLNKLGQKKKIDQRNAELREGLSQRLCFWLCIASL